MAYKKGNFVIKGAAGSVTVGTAGLFLNGAPSVSVRDDSPMDFHKDSDGVIRTITRDQVIDSMTLRLTPGIGDTFADLAAFAVESAKWGVTRKGDHIITSGFDIPALNWPTADKAIITDISYNQAEGSIGEINVTASRYRASDGTTVIDFTGAWAAI